MVSRLLCLVGPLALRHRVSCRSAGARSDCVRLGDHFYRSSLCRRVERRRAVGRLSDGKRISDHERSDADSYDFPESLLRYGLLQKTELRLVVPHYFYDLPAGRSATSGDIALGLKQQLGPFHGFDVSAIFF